MGIGFSTLYKLRALKPVLNFRGLKVPASGAHVTRTVWKHLIKGGYERPEIEAMLALTRSGDRILELGTGMGIVSGVVALSRPQATIAAYEANPALIEPIRRLHVMNGITNVTITNAVLLPTDDPAPIRLNLTENFTESSISAKVDAHNSVEVPVQDLRAVLAEFRPDVFLCDIEGAEENIFDGISLEGLRVMVIELHPKLISRSAVKRIYDLCAAAGLYPRVELSSLQVVAFEKVEPES